MHHYSGEKSPHVYSQAHIEIFFLIPCICRSNFMHKVETCALDDIMVNSIDELAGKVGVLKIDVEGFEPKVSQLSDLSVY